ncbi:MAG: efflux RND transporter periplasmic adaptor subunit [Planctomycetaceae bacterium]|nr:efflux RND transporter periplasmic adaptor subunit [Planctomycetaceae bacterium]
MSITRIFPSWRASDGARQLRRRQQGLRPGGNVPSASTMWAICALLFAVPTISSAQVTHSFTEPFEVLEIAAAEAGIVAELPIRQGQHVQAGEILAVLDHDVLQASLELAQLRAESHAQIEAAQVDVRLKKSQLDKLSLILAGGHASTNEIERATAEYQAALAALKLAEEEHAIHALEVRQIEAQLERRRIRSPVDGVITHIHKRRGEYLSGNDPQLITLVQLDQLRVKFYVTTEVATNLSPTNPIPVQVGTQVIMGAVDFLSPVTDADSGTVRLEVVLSNRQGTLRSGIPCHLTSNEPLSVQAVRN